MITGLLGRQGDGLACLGVDDAPVDELLGDLAWSLVEDHGHREQIFLADRQHAAVVVAALALDRRGVTRQRCRLLGRDVAELLEVQHEPRRRRGRLGGARRRCAVGEQLVDRYAVEVGELGQPLDGHRPVTAFVRADNDCLPSAPGLLLDAVQRKTLLHADGTQSLPQRLGVRSLGFLGHCPLRSARAWSHFAPRTAGTPVSPLALTGLRPCPDCLDPTAVTVTAPTSLPRSGGYAL